jgi:hypothetical protein
MLNGQPPAIRWARNSKELKAMSFADRVDLVLARKRVDDDTGCWLWEGSRLPTGHGSARIAGKAYLVHRLSAMVHLGLDITNRFVGSRKDASQVNHKCANTNCFNPEHLYVGTQLQNIHDIPADKRGKRLATHCANGHPFSGANYKKDVGCLTCYAARKREYWLDRRYAAAA